MAKKRISNRAARNIASKRIQRLLPMAEAEIRAGNVERARRYVHLARRMAMKTNMRMPTDRPYCKACMAPLVPGVSSTVRIRSDRLVIRCTECGNVKRRPYLREKRGLRDGQEGTEGA